MIKEWLTIILLIAGALFMLLASIGIIRLPDIYMRMHASTKAPTLGLLLMLSSLCIYFTGFMVVIKSTAIMFFIFLTTPVASHMIGRTAHLLRTTKWKNTGQDNLERAQEEHDKKTNHP